MTDMLIVKVPLDDSERHQHVRKFKRMPILYLELIENKMKVRSDVVNKPYDPPPPTTVSMTEDSNKSINFDYDDSTNFTPLSAAATAAAGGDGVDESSYAAASVGGGGGDDINGGGTRNGGGNGDVNRGGVGCSSYESPSSVPTTTTDERNNPPTLAELQAKNPKVPILKKDFRYAQEEDEELIKERNQVFFHYEVLKRMHPNAQIPEFTMYSDPKIMAQKYELLTKKLSLDSNVENWKRYMIIFVMGCEVVLGKMNFDMEGFAQQQIMSMNTYDSLLVEMAEKSYVPTGSKWPVELRLFSMVLMNVVLFVVSKIIMKRTGTNLLSHINSMTIPHSSGLGGGGYSSNSGGSNSGSSSSGGINGGSSSGGGGNTSSSSSERVMKAPQ